MLTKPCWRKLERMHINAYQLKYEYNIYIYIYIYILLDDLYNSIYIPFSILAQKNIKFIELYTVYC